MTERGDNGVPAPHEPEDGTGVAAEPEATQAMDRVDLERTQAAPVQPTERMPVSPPVETVRIPASDEPSPAGSTEIDSLFGDDRFREYREAATGQRQERTARPLDERPVERGLVPWQRILLWVAGVVVAALALVALFLVGTRLPEWLAPEPMATPTDTATPTPTPTVAPAGPVAPGVYRWDELLGGECLEPYTDAWADEFTVVDCATPHAGQMVYRGTFPEAADPAVVAPFPGPEALQAQIPILCSAPGVVNLSVAGQYTDIQIQGSYPVTEEQWGEAPTYQCFVSRASGQPMTVSLAVTPAPAS
jgi:hypothetical protein